MREVWKAVPGYEGRYEASSRGRVRSLDRTVEQTNRWGQIVQRFERGKVLASRPDKDGYLRIFSRELPVTGVHQLVARSFVPNPDSKPQVNHKDGNGANNAPRNLEWATNSENHLHAFRVLGRKANRSGERAVFVFPPSGGMRKYRSGAEAARQLGRCKNAVYNAIARGGAVNGHGVRYV